VLMAPHVCQFIPKMIIPVNALRDLGESIVRKVSRLRMNSLYISKLSEELVYASSIEDVLYTRT